MWFFFFFFGKVKKIQFLGGNYSSYAIPLGSPEFTPGKIRLPFNHFNIMRIYLIDICGCTTHSNKLTCKHKKKKLVGLSNSFNSTVNGPLYAQGALQRVAIWSDVGV